MDEIKVRKELPVIVAVAVTLIVVGLLLLGAGLFFPEVVVIQNDVSTGKIIGQYTIGPSRWPFIAVSGLSCLVGTILFAIVRSRRQPVKPW